MIGKRVWKYQMDYYFIYRFEESIFNDHRFIYTNDGVFERLANYDYIHCKSRQKYKLIRCLRNYLIDYQFPHLIWDE